MSVTRFSFENACEIEGLQIITPFVAEDERGEYRKTYEKNIFREHGIDAGVFEIGECVSRKGVIRGLHMQRNDPQPKLVRAAAGSVFDVAVDMRKGSATFGKHFSVILSAENRKMLYIPAGFLHGMMALEDNTVLNYPSFSAYDPDSDGGVIWNDKTLAIKWPADKTGEVIVSAKDSKLPDFEEYVKKYDLR